MSWNPFTWGGNEVMGAEGFSSTPKPASPIDAVNNAIGQDSKENTHGLLTGELDADGNAENYSSLNDSEVSSMVDKLAKTKDSQYEALAPQVDLKLNEAQAESTGVNLDDTIKSQAIASVGEPFEWEEDEHDKALAEFEAKKPWKQRAQVMAQKAKGHLKSRFSGLKGGKGKELGESIGKGFSDIGANLMKDSEFEYKL